MCVNFISCYCWMRADVFFSTLARTFLTWLHLCHIVLPIFRRISNSVYYAILMLKSVGHLCIVIVFVFRSYIFVYFSHMDLFRHTHTHTLTYLIIAEGSIRNFQKKATLFGSTQHICLILQYYYWMACIETRIHTHSRTISWQQNSIQNISVKLLLFGHYLSIEKKERERVWETIYPFGSYILNLCVCGRE